MLCYRCGMRFDATPEQSWENACPRCGCLAWLHHGMTVPVKVLEMVHSHYRTREGYASKLDEPLGARVTVGNELRGIMSCSKELTPGQEVMAKVVSVDHQRRVITLEYRPK